MRCSHRGKLAGCWLQARAGFDPTCKLPAPCSITDFSSPLPPPPPRRAERAKARSLKDKFKGVSREQMAASAGGSPGGAYAGRAGSGFSGAPATSSPGGSSYYSPASAASEPRLGGMEDFGASTHFEGMARPKGRQALPAGERGGESEEERDMHSARASPGKVGWACYLGGLAAPLLESCC